MAYHTEMVYPVQGNVMGNVINAVVAVPDYSATIDEIFYTKADVNNVADIASDLSSRISTLEDVIYGMAEVLSGLKKCVDDAENGLLDSEKFYNEVKMLINI